MNAVMVFLSHPAIARVGWTLLHFLWQGAAVAALLAVALLILRNRSPGARYLVACCALIAMLAAPAVTLFARLSRSAPVVARGADLPELPELPEVRGSAGGEPMDAVVPAAAGEPLPLQSAPAAVAISPSPPIPWKDRALLFIERNLRWLVAGWLAGVTLLATRLMVDFIRVQRIRRRGARPVAATLDATARRLALKLGLRRAVLLFESTLAEVPTAIGWLRPVILLPASLLTRLSPAQLEAILAHELAHVRRHDYLVNLFQTVAETLLFYHPAVHWVSRRIRQERELCCDDLAVALCGDTVAYARALTELAEHSAVPAPAAGASGGSLIARIRRLLGVKDERERLTTKWLTGVMPAAILIAVLALGIACAAPALQATASSAESKTEPPETASVPASTAAFEAFVNSVKPPESGFRLSIDPPKIPQAVIYVQHFVRSMWLDEGAESLVCTLFYTRPVNHVETNCWAVVRYDVKTGKPKWYVEVEGYWRNFVGPVVDPDAGTYTYALEDFRGADGKVVNAYELVVGDLATGQSLRKVSLSPFDPFTLCQGPEGVIFVVATKDPGNGKGKPLVPRKTAVLSIDLRKGVILRSKEYDFQGSYEVALSSAKSRLVAAFRGGPVLFLDPDSLEEVGRTTLDKNLNVFCFQPGQDTLFVGSRESDGWTSGIERFDLAGPEPKLVYRISAPQAIDLGHGRSRKDFIPVHLDCTDDGRYLLSSGDGPVRIYRAEDGKILAAINVLFSHGPPELSSSEEYACFDRRGQHVAVYCGGNVFVWKTEDLLAPPSFNALVEQPKESYPPITASYEEMLKLYADKGLRMPTPEEKAKLGELWPKGPAEWNSAFFLAKAADAVAPKEDIPAGSASAGPDRPYAGDVQAFKKWVDENRAAFHWMRRIGTGGLIQLPIFIEAQSGKPSAGLSELAAIRHLARTVTDAGFLEELEGWPDAAAKRYLDCLGMGARIRGPRAATLTESLVGMAICRMGGKNLDSLIANANVSDELLREFLWKEAQDAEIWPGEVQRDWGQETEFALASLELDPTYANNAQPILADRVRRFHLAVAKVLAERPFTDLLQKKTMAELFEGPLKEFEKDSMAASFQRWLVAMGQAEVQWRETQIRAAIEVWRRLYHRLPESLSRLCPQLLPEIPLDPFSGKPMQYALTAEGWKVWSVGEDNVDHGGVSAAAPEALRKESSELWRGPDYVFVSNLASNLEIRSGGKSIPAPAEKPKETGGAASADYSEMLKLYPEADMMRMPTAAEIQALGPLWPSFPAAENAAYYLMQAAARVSDTEKAPEGSTFLDNNHPYDGDKIAFEQWAAANQPALDAISLVLRAPHSQFPVFYKANEDVPAWWEQSSLRLEVDPKTHNPLQPGDAVAVRKMTRLLTDEGFAAELDGKPDAAVGHYLTCVQISSRLRDHVTSMLDALIVEVPAKAGAIYADRVMANASLTDETLRRVISVCRSAPLSPGMLSEIVQGQAVLDKLVVQDKPFGGLAKLYLPFYEAAQKVIPGKSLTELLQPGVLGNLEGQEYTYPAFRGLLVAIAQSEVQLRETEIRAALALYQRQTGRLPDSLNELVPGLLPEAPTDPFSGKPMRYARTADGWKVWSVGESGVDHGGVSNASPEALRQESGELFLHGPDYVFVSNLASNLEVRSGGKLRSSPAEKPK